MPNTEDASFFGGSESMQPDDFLWGLKIAFPAFSEGNFQQF